MKTFLFFLLIVVVQGQKELDGFLYGKFPEGFKFGYATASYQIEGAWNVSGKGENIWDWWTHLDPNPVDDQSTGDVACDSYHRWEEDVALLKAAHAQTYRFSVSWNRIIDFDNSETVNEAGVAYYNNLIDKLISEGIEPMITMFHWDTPKVLELNDSLPQGHPDFWIGGWTNDELIRPYFLRYADVLYQRFGDRVKHWITFNEPWVICWQGYGIASKAPGRVEPDTLPYDCAHTILKTHADVYHLYVEKYREVQKGFVGITLDTYWYEPASEKAEDVEAAERVLQFHHGWFAWPLYFGDYPPKMKDLIAKKSNEEGRHTSRLPSWDANWSVRVKGTIDFLGLNHYTSALVEHKPAERGSSLGWNNDMDAFMFQSPAWQCSGSPWLKVNPPGFRKLLRWLKETYDDPEIIVTENGTSEDDAVAGAFGPSGLNDVARQYYYTLYINNMLKAIVEDKVNVTLYTAWSLLDNFEWKRGYTQRFGAHRVEFTHPTDRPRAAKESVSLLREIFDDNGFLRPNEIDGNDLRKYHTIVNTYTPGEINGAMVNTVSILGLVIALLMQKVLM